MATYFREWSATKKAAAKRFVDERVAVIRLHSVNKIS